MSETKMKICKHCGAEIAKSAKVCPNCGGKNPKPIYKRVWFWLLIIVVLLSLFGGSDDSKSKNKTADTGTQAETVEYTAVTTDELSDDLDKNAAAASDKYKGNYYAVTGKLSVIDSDCAYISLVDQYDEWSIHVIQCKVKDEEQKKIIKKLSIDQIVTVKGKITDVGELMGYYMDIDEIVS